MSDWFQQNAPGAAAQPPPAAGTNPPPPASPPAGGGSWFQQNAPGTSVPSTQTGNAGLSTVAPVSQSQTAALSTPLTPDELVKNPNKENVFRMKVPGGGELGIPYSKAKMLGRPQGYTFADPQEAQRFMKYYANDPEVIQSMAHLANDNPGLGMFLGMARHALQYLFGTSETLTGDEKGKQSPKLSPNLASQLRAPWESEPGAAAAPSPLKQFANSPDETFAQRLGGLGFEARAFASGEGEARALVTGERMLKHPIVSGAVTQGATAGAQTYMKTGDAGTSLRAAAETSAISLVTGGAFHMAGAGITGAQEASATRGAAEAAQVAEAERVAKNAEAKNQFTQATQQYQSDLNAYKKQAVDLNAQHAEDVRTARAAHDQNVATLKAQYPEQVAAARATHNQTIADLEAQHEKNMAAANIGHSQKVADWKTQHAEAIDTARQQHEQMTTTAKADYQQRVTAAQQKAQTTAEAAQAQEEQARQTAASQAYGQTAGASVEPNLRAVEEAGQANPRPITMNQPGGGPGIPSGFERPLVHFNTDEMLGRIGDYTGARSELQNGLNQVSGEIDEATEGRYTTLRNEVSKAQTQMWKTGSPEAEALYKQKLGEFDQLLESTSGRVRTGLTDAVRSGWRKYYVLGDISNGLDKAVRGVPGDTSISQIHRGLDGRTLTTELSRLVRRAGRGPVEEALGGPDRLRTLEEIGQQTTTQSGRKAFNAAIVNVARYMEPVEPAALPLPFNPPAPATPKPTFIKPPKPETPVFTPPPKPTIEAFIPPPKPEMPTKPVPPTRPIPIPAPISTMPAKPTGPSAARAAGKIVRGTIEAAASTIGMAKGGLATAFGYRLAAQGGVELTAVTTRKVQDVLVANPQIAKYLLYAARTGANPKLYGPMIASMIVGNTRQQQQQEEDQQQQQEEDQQEQQQR